MTIKIIHFLFMGLVVSDLILVFIVIKQRWRKTKLPPKTPRQKLYIILPVYCEKATIKSTIQFLEEIACDHVEKIFIVGNSRERTSDGTNPTLLTASECVSNAKNFTIIEYPNDKAIKAHQVNYAAHNINDDPTRTWIYIMDIDTRFDEHAFYELLNDIESGHRIIQQHTHFFRGFTSRPFLVKCSATYQSRWTLAHEIARIWLFNKLRLGVYHLVGHGLCVQLQKYREVGGFSEDFLIEDVHFGYVCALLGEPVCSSRSLEGSDSPRTFKEWWWQQYGWSLGVMQAPLYFLHFIRSRDHFTIFQCIQQIFALWNYFRWLFNSMAIWFVVFCGFYGIGYGVFFTIAFFIVYAGTFLASAVYFRREGVYGGSYAFFVLSSIVYSFYRSAPVIHCFIEYVIGIRRQKYKTEHGIIHE